MNSFRDRDSRKFILGGMVLIIALVFVISLFNLQVVDETARLSADDNTIRTEIVYPSRGKIFDRNGKLLVYNKAAYDLMVLPQKLEAFDTLKLCSAINVTPEALARQLTKAKNWSWNRASILFSQLSAKDYAFLQEILYQFPGFYVQQRTIRAYNYPNAAQVLGYLGEVTPEMIKDDPFYKSGDYAGMSGIEKTYEEFLRGEKGQRLIFVDRFGREKGSYKNGAYDQPPVTGSDITLSIDIDLQIYAEKLMQNKLGSVVAIEPKTGEVLALVSAPTFDPTVLTGRLRSDAFISLNTDTLKPLINRAIQGNYSPGSTFKMVVGAIALQEQSINQYTLFSCQGEASKPIGCSHSHVSPLNVVTAIELSCNPFFYKTFYQTIERPTLEEVESQYVKWADYVRSFGFGKKLGIDLPYEYNGSVPEASYYDKVYRNVWRANTIRSLAIGQGELLVTPIQIANEAVVMANSGKYYIPHIVKSIGHEKYVREKYTELHRTKVDSSNFKLIREGMREVFSGEHGTARWYRNRSMEMGGKTGTVENSQGENHSVFLAFAPFDDPQIAISTLVENAGFGSTYAAPITTLLMEKYITDSIPPYHKYYEDQMLETNLIDHGQETE
ncbi:penicillin-binding protein 2 [Saccharicrinis sp. FJH54]|uniref:penicillin-binding protein 2 n=1 Tax=Saccharicrinis sp. FJH54 TaxID=3344665 RepID=UPI0035D4E7B4